MDKKEMIALLETPLDPNLDYYDASGSIEVIAKHIDGLHKLINALFENLAIQGASILAVRRKLVELEADFAAHQIKANEPRSAIIMPSREPN